jgi:hypothetical protein
MTTPIRVDKGPKTRNPGRAQVQVESAVGRLWVELASSIAVARVAGIGALPPPAARLKPPWGVPSLG